MPSNMGSDSRGGVEVIQIDEVYEFSAPRFFDFLNEETGEEISRAELWFETSLSYAPSPFMQKIKDGRSVQIDSLCDFGNVELIQKEPEEDMKKAGEQRNDPTSEGVNPRHGQEPIIEVEQVPHQDVNGGRISFEYALCDANKPLQQEKSSSVETSTSTVSSVMSKETVSFAFSVVPMATMAETPDISAKAPPISFKGSAPMRLKNQRTSEACTPKAQRILVKEATAPTNHKDQTARKIGNLRQQPSAITMKDQTPYLQSSRSTKLKSVIKHAGNTAKVNSMANDIAHENQAIKRQKLDDGISKQILNVKTRVLPHKSKPGSAGDADTFSVPVRGYREAATFISMAEMVKKFQSRTRDIDFNSVSHESTALIIQRRPKLTLTRPKEPEFETTQRVRAVRMKSSAELEEEMLAKIPKFKARPINKKILEAPSLPLLPRRTPQLPEFQEFHLKTMERASQHAENSSVVSDTLSQSQSKPFRLTEPRPPNLETALRARPPKIKSSQELEVEELEKIPKFKALPLNKKIFESKGDLGLFYKPKPQVTIPQYFHFATDARLGPPPAAVTELFDKLSLYSDSSSRHDNHDTPRTTIPNPFHLHTEKRGVVKEKQFSLQILEKQLEEEEARVPKANPYPYTTDYPVIPPKPQPKQCTKPEPFQLESLVRHEEEMQRKQEEKERMEKEEAQQRMFKAQPVLREDPIPLPERERKPLTDVQEFVLNVDHRAVERSDFDKKVKEKEMMHKRLREENESAKMIEEEKALKQMRRTMVPHALPVPKFGNPFQPQKSAKEITKPKSPLLRVKMREERRKHVYMR